MKCLDENPGQGQDVGGDHTGHQPQQDECDPFEGESSLLGESVAQASLEQAPEDRARIEAHDLRKGAVS